MTVCVARCDSQEIASGGQSQGGEVNKNDTMKHMLLLSNTQAIQAQESASALVEKAASSGKSVALKSKGPARSFLEFFAGSGLVAQGLKEAFEPVWANDIDLKKAAVYKANHPSNHFHLGSIADVEGNNLPTADMAWASFPCQDLSLAGQAGGIHGKRSGLVWEWLRIIDEMPKPPPILVAENVLGLV